VLWVCELVVDLNKQGPTSWFSSVLATYSTALIVISRCNHCLLASSTVRFWLGIIWYVSTTLCPLSWVSHLTNLVRCVKMVKLIKETLRKLNPKSLCLLCLILYFQPTARHQPCNMLPGNNFMLSNFLINAIKSYKCSAWKESTICWWEHYLTKYPNIKCVEGNIVTYYHMLRKKRHTITYKLKKISSSMHLH